MNFRDKISEIEERKKEAKNRLFDEPIIEDIGSEFDLSDEVKDAAILIFRLFVGLGKGLSSSQRRSFSAVSVWHAKKLIDNKEITKSELANAVDISTRTLNRRFKDLKDDDDSRVVLDFVKYRIKEWSKKRDRKLQEWL